MYKFDATETDQLRWGKSTRNRLEIRLNFELNLGVF